MIPHKISQNLVRKSYCYILTLTLIKCRVVKHCTESQSITEDK